MGVAHQFCLSHQICCPIPATIKNCFTSLKGLCGVLFVLVPWWLDTVQDFFIKLGIKPRMHLLEIGIFHYMMSLSDVPKSWKETSKIGYMFRKLSMYYKIKVFKKIISKSWSPSLIFITEKKIRKIPLNFDAEKWLWKYENCNIWGGCSYFW